jgi:hypothetical protein
MKIQLESVLGVFACIRLLKDPEDYLLKMIECNAFHIYNNESQELYYIYLYKSYDNYTEYHKFEEGFVKVETALREIHFYPTQTYEWNVGGCCGYDCTYYKHQKYNKEDNQGERYKLIKRKVVYFKNEADRKTYKNINTDPNYEFYGYISLNESETIEMMQEIKSYLVNWREWIEDRAIELIKKDAPVEEIAVSCGLTVEEIQALQAGEKPATT